MFYLTLIIGFDLEIDQIPLTLHENCLCPLIGSGGAVFIDQPEVGL